MTIQIKQNALPSKWLAKVFKNQKKLNNNVLGLLVNKRVYALTLWFCKTVVSLK